MNRLVEQPRFHLLPEGIDAAGVQRRHPSVLLEILPRRFIRQLPQEHALVRVPLRRRAALDHVEHPLQPLGVRARCRGRRLNTLLGEIALQGGTQIPNLAAHVLAGFDIVELGRHLGLAMHRKPLPRQPVADPMLAQPVEPVRTKR